MGSIMNTDKLDITIVKYKNTRYWALWVNKEFLAVVCYKKGAMAIKEMLCRIQTNNKY
jgi:hypothetical protein